MRGGRAAEFTAALILLLGTWLGFATSGLPAVVPASAAAGEFSAERAMQDLQTITARPHPVGTVAHDVLRDVLVDRLRGLGLTDVHVQSATGFNTLSGPLAATVANVVGRKRGRTRGPALLLMAHYDAVPRSFGAGDDGAGVAAILETLRALSVGPPLEHDLVVLFSDAEEDGLLGAEAFVDLHPWAREIGTVLNFEGRGDAGPVYMFQTSPGNAPLIKALARHVRGARTNSLTGEVYRHLPSDTDLSIWLHSDYAVGALNFAHVGGYARYHTPSDNLSSLDARVVQQMGNYALGMTKGLDGADSGSMRANDAIYFNAPLLGVVHYPSSWALVLAIDGLAIVVVLLGFGIYRRTLTLPGLGRGLLALALSLAVPAIGTAAGWKAISALHPAYHEILQGDPYNSLWYLLAFSGFTVAVVLEVQRRFAARTTPMEMAIVQAVVWGVLGLAVAVALPGASYLFAWPMFAAAMCASFWRRAEKAARVPAAWWALLALPALVLWPPLVRALEVALTADRLLFCAVLIALMLSIVTLPLQLVGSRRRWLAIAAGVVGAGALLRAELSAGFTATNPRPNSLARIVDADSQRGWWASFDRTVDPWTAGVLGSSPARRTFPAFGLGHDSVLANTLTDTITAAPAPLQILESVAGAGGRRVHLRIARSGPGEIAALCAPAGVTVRDMIINGRRLANGGADRYRPQYHAGPSGTILRYFGVPEEGVDLQFTIGSPEPIAWRLVSEVEWTTADQARPRPSAMMSKPFVPTDMTITGWTVRF